MRCEKCKGLMERTVLPAHTEDLGGVVVKVSNAAMQMRCATCDEEMTAVPDMAGLARATAISRALNPVRLRGEEVKFMRRVLDMTQQEFATLMDLTVETVSRWENDRRGVGGASEKLMRHNICALLYKGAKGRPYDPAVIANMTFTTIGDDEKLPPIEMVRVRVPDESPKTDSWGEMAA